MLGLYNKYKAELLKAGILLVAFVVVYGIAVVRTNAHCEVAQATAQVEGVKSNEQIRQKIRAISTPDLDKRLMRWVQHD